MRCCPSSIAQSRPRSSALHPGRSVPTMFGKSTEGRLGSCGRSSALVVSLHPWTFAIRCGTRRDNCSRHTSTAACNAERVSRQSRDRRACRASALQRANFDGAPWAAAWRQTAKRGVEVRTRLSGVLRSRQGGGPSGVSQTEPRLRLHAPSASAHAPNSGRCDLPVALLENAVVVAPCCARFALQWFCLRHWPRTGRLGAPSVLSIVQRTR
jgi:hypothetical protein